MPASAPAFTAFVDPDDERFLRLQPGELPAAVHAFCQETGQPTPGDQSTLVRVLLESLALKYAVVLRELEAASGRMIEAVHVVGGGRTTRCCASSPPTRAACRCWPDLPKPRRLAT